MINSPNIPLYAHKAAIHNYLYCVKYGYTFIVEKCPQIDDMDKDYMWNGHNEYLLVWSKHVFIQRHLENYKYVFFIDSDAIFIDLNKSIESFIKQFFTNDDICIIGGQDCKDKNLCWNINNINTGAMVFKNSKKTFEILEHWNNAIDNECIQYKYVHAREQDCLNILKNKYYENNIKVLPYFEIGGTDGIFVRHYVNETREYRNEEISKHLYPLFNEMINNGNLMFSSHVNSPNKLLSLTNVKSI
jgi:hypothetical protein